MGSKNKKKVQKKQKREFEDVIESDETFAFIAGYTSGGAPYGVTWEESMKHKNKNKCLQKVLAIVQINEYNSA